MSTTTIENFFTGKTLVIPNYQRDYAWKERNVDDLFDDVEEALDSDGGHYLGTFILSKSERDAALQVVDGQQRLTTLTMMLEALTCALDEPELQRHYRNIFIENPVHGAKFRVLGENEAFFRGLLAGQPHVPASDGQERLLRASLWIRQRVNALCTSGGQEVIKKWLLCISKMEVMEFIEPNEGKAIRMFQSVNDRGVPLSKMDIVKSLLVYYSNRYLDAALDGHIAQQFGRAYRSFSRIKRLAGMEGYKIRQVDRDVFREDDVLRYHYLAFDGSALGTPAGGDYSATSEAVLDSFLKRVLPQLRGDKARLSAFITTYTDDLTAFFGALEQLIEATHTDRAAYLLWVVQDLSATLYPLVIRLHLLGRTGSCPSNDPRTLLQIIELTDLRVFKLRGTNPQADIFRITRELARSSVDQVAADLLSFCQRFMPDALMESRLVDEELYRNPALPRMLLQEEDEARLAVSAGALDLPSLAALNRDGLTVEHILPQEPDNSFNVAGYGFSTNDDYAQFKHRFGNLVLLEGSINSACNNRTVEAKMSSANLYKASSLCAVQAVSASRAGAGKQFDRAFLLSRCKDLAAMVKRRWHI